VVVHQLWSVVYIFWTVPFGLQILGGFARFGGPPNPFFIFGILFMGPHWAFSHCHVASNHWSTSTNCRITCHVSVRSTTSTCHVIVRSTMSLYKLPCGTFLLVHRMTQKCKKLVTCGSLWWFHVTMMTSCLCQHDTCHLLCVPRMLYRC